MSDATFSDIDHETKMAWVWTTLNFQPSKLKPLLDEFYFMNYKNR